MTLIVLNDCSPGVVVGIEAAVVDIVGVIAGITVCFIVLSNAVNGIKIKYAVACIETAAESHNIVFHNQVLGVPNNDSISPGMFHTVVSYGKFSSGMVDGVIYTAPTGLIGNAHAPNMSNPVVFEERPAALTIKIKDHCISNIYNDL